jgi:hypothetical protein
MRIFFVYTPIDEVPLHLSPVCLHHHLKQTPMESTTSVFKPEPSYHGMIRMDQRGISKAAVQTVIDKGRVIHKQSLKYFFVPKSQTRDWTPGDQEAVMDLVVITDLYIREVVTCYRHPQAVHKIKKKSKRLKKKNT